MKIHLSVPFCLVLLGVVTASSMTGCAGVSVAPFPESAPLPTVGQVGSISGSNYGGHAPLVGAHIYLVQPGTTGYGSIVTSLLSNSTNNPSYPLVANGSWPTATSGGFNADQFVPVNGDLAGDTNTTPFNGVTTDVNGQFYISGDYTCQPGPVILIGYGGYPSYVPTTTGGTNTFNITNVTVSNYVGGANPTATYTFSVGNPPELFYVGESVAINGLGLDSFTGANPISTVLPANLGTGSFSMTLPDNGGLTGGPYATSGATAVATPSFNPAAVNMAVLGNCPSNGTFATGASAIRYVYMNEISTVAAAYAFSPFANWAADDQHGNDEFHIGAPASSAAALQIAAVTAGNLYDIQGGNVATTPAPQDGDVHIARTVTPSGTGTVPQAQIDFIGNILAACVDSNNTYRLSTGVKSQQCQNLGFYATDNGVYDTTNSTTHQAFNIAQAAMNMARFPQGAGTGSSTNCNGVNYCTTQTITSAPTAATASAFTAGAYNIVTGNVPFTGANPLTSAPNDYAIAITWSDASANAGTAIGTSGLAVDATGNVWLAAPTYNATGGAFKFSPTTGLFSSYTGPLSPQVSGVAIDTVGTVWMAGAAGAEAFVSGTPTGTAAGTGVNGADVAVDSSYVYMPTNYDGSGDGQLVKQVAGGPSSGVTATGFPLGTGAASSPANSIPGCLFFIHNVAVDPTGNIWTSSVNPSGYTPGDSICEFNSSGALLYSYFFSSLHAGSYFPHRIAMDAGSNAWFADDYQNFVGKIPAGLTTANNNTGLITNTGGSLSTTRAVTVDGANSIWVSNAGTSSIGHYTDSNVSMAGTYYTGGSGGNALSFMQSDASGNVWASGQGQGNLVQFVGIATPTITPISVARAAGNTGGKPGLSVAHVTSYSIYANTLYITASPVLRVGETVTLSGFPNSTFLNGQTLTIATVNGNVVAGSFSYPSNVANTSETGVLSPIN